LKNLPDEVVVTPISTVRAGAFVLLAVMLACTPGVDPKSLLWIPLEAAIMFPVASYPSGNIEVSFTIPITDVAQQEAFTARLLQKLERSGWRRRTHQYLNPTVVTSFKEGWRTGGGGVRLPGARQNAGNYKWHGEWEDTEGNVIQYSLQAFHYTDGQGQLRIFAMYVPVKLVLAGENGNYR
jgi:hypothetical protein